MRHLILAIVGVLGTGLFSTASAQYPYDRPPPAPAYQPPAYQPPANQPGGARRLDAMNQEVERLQGTWLHLGKEQGGVVTPSPAPGNIEFIFRGNNWWRMNNGELVNAGTFEIVGLGPRFNSLNATITHGQSAGQRVHAIYRIDGDQMQYTFAGIGVPAPDRLETDAARGYGNTVWRRAPR